MMERLAQKLAQRDQLTSGDRAALEALPSTTVSVRKGETLVNEGDRPVESILLLDGMTARFKAFPDGRRQLLALHISGDFVDLHSFLLKTMDHGVLALTPCRITKVPHEAIRRLTEQRPHLTRLLWLNTLLDTAILREWTAGLGRRTALGRAAHLICELALRHQVVGLGGPAGFRFPLTQAELGDALGLSTVHVNRVIQQLREGLIVWDGGDLRILDWPALVSLAEFDPGYLYLEQEPR
jgi:CRP-like cAMP-binding protein